MVSKDILVQERTGYPPEDESDDLELFFLDARSRGRSLSRARGGGRDVSGARFCLDCICGGEEGRRQGHGGDAQGLCLDLCLDMRDGVLLTDRADDVHVAVDVMDGGC